MATWITIGLLSWALAQVLVLSLFGLVSDPTREGVVMGGVRRPRRAGAVQAQAR